MNVLIVYCHPEPKSFNAAMFDSAKTALENYGHVVTTTDVYAEAFDPLSSRKNFKTVADPDHLKLSVEEAYALKNDGFEEVLELEMQKLENCDLMILQFPLWWYGMPAGLKGWIDRVFAFERVYGFGHMFSKGKMAGKKAMLSFSTGVPEAGYQPGALAGDVNLIVKPIHYGVLQFVGFEVLKPHVVYAPVQKSDEERRAEIDAFTSRLSRIFDEEAIPVEGF